MPPRSRSSGRTSHASLLQRASEAPVTGKFSEPCNRDDAWLRVTEEVRGAVKRRGGPLDAIDDAVQSATLKALLHDGGFDSREGMVRWMIVVAWNEIIGELRRRAKFSSGAMPDRPAGLDPGTAVENRLTLAAVAHGIERLSELDRESIVGGLSSEMSRRSPEKSVAKVRRHRARQHLALLVEDQIRNR
jgi:DNA-directed RNA polymerase specialized sigma24 family protein